MTKPKLALTMGDVAGIGPEVVAKVLADDEFCDLFTPVVIGSEDILKRAAQQLEIDLPIRNANSQDELFPAGDEFGVWNPSSVDVRGIEPGKPNEKTGQAAYDFLIAAIELALDGKIDGIVTAPISKAAFRQAGIEEPGHTEILARCCGRERFAMLLYLPCGERVAGKFGLGVAHVTLHMAIKDVPASLNGKAIEEKIELLHDFFERIHNQEPRIAVAALNPHAGENGMFGDEESRIIQPAVQRAQKRGRNVVGPIPCDTLIHRAVGGEFDGVVAMYHDQGHIALKLLDFHRAVNITLGLPIVRTSPSHGTAFDIAGKGIADASGMQEAIQLAVLLSR